MSRARATAPVEGLARVQALQQEAQQLVETAADDLIADLDRIATRCGELANMPQLHAGQRDAFARLGMEVQTRNSNIKLLRRKR
jgi:hypothetical protein